MNWYVLGVPVTREQLEDVACTASINAWEYVFQNGIEAGKHKIDELQRQPIEWSLEHGLVGGDIAALVLAISDAENGGWFDKSDGTPRE